jgi:hypothetical protein
MAHRVTQASTIAKINANLIKGVDLPDSRKWITHDKKTLLSTIFSEYWIIHKKTAENKYDMFCGTNVNWMNTHYAMPSKIPDITLVFEDNDFKGVLLGDTVKDLCQMGIYGIFMWILPVPVQTAEERLLELLGGASAAPAPAPAAPVAYIRVGNNLIPVPAGHRVDVVHHGVPNAFAPMMNISHFRRG